MLVSPAAGRLPQNGANQWRLYTHVVLPMARPALGALTIITFQGSWNDFFWPLVVLTTPEDVKTLPIGLLSFRNAYAGAGDWGLILAGAVLSAPTGCFKVTVPQ